MTSVSVGGLVLGALALFAFALVMSRRSLGVSAFLCVVALTVLGYGAGQWAHWWQ